MRRIIYFGPPGTGKTTTLLERLEEHLKQDVPVDRIAFLTFTRRARREAVERVEAALGIKARDLRYFRTIHSMAFRALKLSQEDVMGWDRLQEFGAALGLTFGKSSLSEQAAEGITSQNKGDQLIAIDNLSRLRGQSVKETWSKSGSGIPWPEVDYFIRSYRDYKQERALLDYTDILEQFVKKGDPVLVDVAFIDEAQDLSALQWLAALRAVGAAPYQYVAGDDDQAIFRWAGAQVEVFMSLEGERVVLDQSYRVPKAVHQIAQQVVKRIKNRVPKEVKPRSATGMVHYHQSADSIDVKDGSQWLWLVRNRYLMEPLKARLIASGVVFAQHGTSSIVASEYEAIYTWERLRKGSRAAVPSIRDMYKKLRSGSQIARGHKLLPKAHEDEALNLEELQTDHGLLATGVWFEVFDTIPLARRSYYRLLLRKRGTLKIEPQVQLETIHGAKGAEAPCVALFLEQSRRTWEESQQLPEEEHRVWYVGLTRAREELHVISASGRYAYSLPQKST